MTTPFFNLGAGLGLIRSNVEHDCADHDETMAPPAPTDDDGDAFSAALENDDTPVPVEGDESAVADDDEGADETGGGKEKKSKKGKSGKSGKSKKSGKGKKSKKDKGDAADQSPVGDEALPSDDTFDAINDLIDAGNAGLDAVVDEIINDLWGTPDTDNDPSVDDTANEVVPGPVTGPVPGAPPVADEGAPPIDNETPLVNTVVGGTGQAQLDMDGIKPGTQVNVVLGAGMADSDRANVFEALTRWSDASGGELEFSVYNEGEQPGGEEYIILNTVAPDDTGKSGIADVGRSPDGVTEMEFEAGSGLNIVMHEFGHTLGLGHGDGVQKAVDPTTEFSEQNLADLAALYPDMNQQA